MLEFMEEQMKRTGEKRRMGSYLNPGNKGFRESLNSEIGRAHV